MNHKIKKIKNISLIGFNVRFPKNNRSGSEGVRGQLHGVYEAFEQQGKEDLDVLECNVLRGNYLYDYR